LLKIISPGSDAHRIGPSGAALMAHGQEYLPGRQDSTIGYLGAANLFDHYPRATLVVLDGAGHACPERPELLAGLLQEWLARTGASV
jgi:pimeloyl-ACP methyl ester carboxylesterase